MRCKTLMIIFAVAGMLFFTQLNSMASAFDNIADFILKVNPGAPATAIPDDFLRSGSDDEYGLNYVGVIREFTNKSGTRYHSEFLGYTYGNDAMVFNVNTGVKRYGQWNVEANGFFMWHGTMDIYSMWSLIGGTGNAPYDISTPTTSHPTGNYNDSDVSDRNSVSQTMVLGVNGAYDINEHLHVFGQLDYININNYKNIADSKASDVQLTMGATYSL